MSRFKEWLGRRLESDESRVTAEETFNAGYEMATEEYKVVSKTNNRIYLVRDTAAAKSMGEKIAEAKPSEIVFMTEDEFEECSLMVVVDV